MTSQQILRKFVDGYPGGINPDLDAAYAAALGALKVDETRIEVVLAALRWANNMLVEVLSNHGEQIGRKSESARDLLRSAVSTLNDVDSQLRRS